MGKVSQKRDGSIFSDLISLFIIFLCNNVDLSRLKFKYDSTNWKHGFAKDCLDSSSNYPSTTYLKSNGHPRHHVDSGENLDELIKKHRGGFEITPNPIWISHENKDLSKKKGKN